MALNTLTSVIDTYEVYASFLKWERCGDHQVEHAKYNGAIIHRFHSATDGNTKVVFHCIASSNPILDKRSSISMDHLTCQECRKDKDTCYIMYDLVYLLMSVDYGRD